MTILDEIQGLKIVRLGNFHDLNQNIPTFGGGGNFSIQKNDGIERLVLGEWALVANKVQMS